MTFIHPYLKIARIDHWFKNVFMLPGVLVACYIDSICFDDRLLIRVLLALLVLGLITSSNYVLNEILDADRDRHHPVKKNRPVPSGQVNIPVAYVLWLVLGAAGALLAWELGKGVFQSALVLWIMGCLYNFPPVRTKEVPYLDVLTESLNNPLRLLVGWYATGTLLTAPLSLVLAYWMIGAFFMAAKRYAEYRHIDDPEGAAAYRKSFRHYTEERLIISIVYYSSAFALFFGIFLIRYRIELILSIPLIAGFVAWYMHLAFQPDSPVQYPEKLYRQKGFVVYTLTTALVCLALLYVDIPALESMFAQTVAGS
jgi:4-hydroxybenzoate polyprenyltransferase